jgi:hypothetical protein
MASMSALISSTGLRENFSVLYMLQKAQWFHGQFRVNRTSSDALPPSLGGRYMPVSNRY